MSLPAGTRLGVYGIVAIKVLPDRLSGDPEALARFEGETLRTALTNRGAAGLGRTL